MLKTGGFHTSNLAAYLKVLKQQQQQQQTTTTKSSTHPKIRQQEIINSD